ncbi:hypothetical protein CupriaWKF_33615 [Cupriavidus sp. WKF15]|uniref:hypothetical protein n=1 Tax=Cupriavidus TaxID=106589 RepID=UPI00112D95F6|nr:MULTISPECIES: hypothetical protein [Cupriavidus]TPQ36135.1 hypothetical protein C2U69_19285 [Cupriavidus pinatubonensis]WER50485.1 hypothetical protein CupriaWKF_33615 [Cupriavidus sp. WKF15]
MNQAQMQVRVARAKNIVREIIAREARGEAVDSDVKFQQPIVSTLAAHGDAKEVAVTQRSRFMWYMGR